MFLDLGASLDYNALACMKTGSYSITTQHTGKKFDPFSPKVNQCALIHCITISSEMLFVVCKLKLQKSVLFVYPINYFIAPSFTLILLGALFEMLLKQFHRFLISSNLMVPTSCGFKCFTFQVQHVYQFNWHFHKQSWVFLSQLQLQF